MLTKILALRLQQILNPPQVSCGKISAKQQMFFKAWSKKRLKYGGGNTISLDNDYFLDIQHRYKELHIKFRSPFPASLKVLLETGEKTLCVGSCGRTETSGNKSTFLGKQTNRKGIFPGGMVGTRTD